MSAALDRLHHCRHKVVIVLDPQHADIPDADGKPGKAPGQLHHGQDAGHRIDALIPEIDTALLTQEAFGRQHFTDVVVGVLPLGIVAGRLQRFGIQVESDGMHGAPRRSGVVADTRSHS